MHPQVGSTERCGVFVDNAQAGLQRDGGAAVVVSREPQQRLGVPRGGAQVGRSAAARLGRAGQVAPGDLQPAAVELDPTRDEQAVQRGDLPAGGPEFRVRVSRIVGEFAGAFAGRPPRPDLELPCNQCPARAALRPKLLQGSSSEHECVGCLSRC